MNSSTHPGAVAPIELAREAEFQLGEAVVRPSSREVLAAGRTIALEPRVMQVLVALAGRQGETVTRDDLIALCWGGLIVGDDAIQRCIARLRKLASETGGFRIETLPRLGYRLTPSETAAPPTPGLRSPHNARPAVIIGAFRAIEPTRTDAIFIELLADDIAAALSISRDLNVLAQCNGSEPFAGACYLLEATLRHTDSGRRIAAHLQETASGQILWAHRFDDPHTDQAEPCDDLVVDFAGRVVTEIMRRETDMALAKPGDLTAWEAVVRSNAAYQRINLKSLAFALTEARRAVAIDPSLGAAHAALAHALAATYEVSGASDPSLAAEARRAAETAVLLDPDNPNVLAAAANALTMTTRPPEGLALALRAIELAPHHRFAHLYLARRYVVMARPDEALAELAIHERVSPLFPWQYFIAFMKALAYFMRGDVEDASRELDRAALLNPDYQYTWIGKAIVAVMLGRTDEAAQAAARLKALDGADSLPLQLSRVAHSYPAGPAREAVLGLLRQAWMA